MRSRRWPPARRRRSSTARRVRRRREGHGLVVAVGAADALAVGGKRPGEPAAEHILERLGVDRPDDPVGGRPGGRLAQPRPRVPPTASNSSRDSDRANCETAFHIRKLGENVSTPCASCAAEVLDRRSSSCSERITSEPRGARRQAAPGSACDSSRRAAQRKSPCHGDRCSARGQPPLARQPAALCPQNAPDRRTSPPPGGRRPSRRPDAASQERRRQGSETFPAPQAVACCQIKPLLLRLPATGRGT